MKVLLMVGRAGLSPPVYAASRVPVHWNCDIGPCAMTQDAFRSASVEV